MATDVYDCVRPNKRTLAVIGGGPAGLRAAEVAATAGTEVTLYDRMPSVGRKFLVAGKSGLNLTNAIDWSRFLEKYSGMALPEADWRRCLNQFNSDDLREWARSLGVETFVASGGKVFPESKKAAPLLRRWVLRLKQLGVVFSMNHQWCGLHPDKCKVQLKFSHRGETIRRAHDTVVLALGGGSWPQTGSDGTWVSILAAQGVAIEALQSANCGWECSWTEATRSIAEGQPLHHLEIRANNDVRTGELMVTRYGFEGAPLYQLGRTLRQMEFPVIEIDFKPMFSLEHMVRKMESARKDFYKEAMLRWKLPAAVCAILRQIYGEFDSAEALAYAAKHCRIGLNRARPIAEAISTAGGIAWSELDADLMLSRLPGVYCAGEMLDWEAPTGGYLIQACFATGTTAGLAAVR